MEWYRIPPPPRPELIESGLVERVAQQLGFYRTLGIVDEREDIVRGEEGEQYAFPTATGITDLVRTNWDDRYSLKVQQGFNTLLVIPGIVGHQKFQESLGQVIVARKDSIASPWDETLGVDVDEPVWGYWADDPIQYRTTQTLYTRGELPEWVDRPTFYRNLSWPGFDVVLIRSADAKMPRKGYANPPSGGRPDTEGGKSPIDHREMFGTSPYDFECALSTDGHLAYYLESIREQGIALDVWTSQHGTVSWSSDNRFETEEEDPADAYVPCSYWDRDYRRVGLDGDRADRRDERYAVRGAVRITA